MKEKFWVNILCICFTLTLFGYGQKNFLIKGKVTEVYGAPVQGATVTLDSAELSAETDENGNFVISYGNSVNIGEWENRNKQKSYVGHLQLPIASSMNIHYSINSLKGELVESNTFNVKEAGIYSLWLTGLIPRSVKTGIYLIKINAGAKVFSHIVCNIAQYRNRYPVITRVSGYSSASLLKVSANVWDSLKITKDNYSTVTLPLDKDTVDLGNIEFSDTPLDSGALVATWHMVNVSIGVNEGDANIITIKDRVIMVDAGLTLEAKTALIPFLKEKNITVVHDFFLSHAHFDHYQGVREMLKEKIKIKNFYMTVPPKNLCDLDSECDFADFEQFIIDLEAKGANIIEPETGQVYNLPYGSKIEIVMAQKGPSATMDSPTIDDMSLIMKWTAGLKTVLFTGDVNVGLNAHLTAEQLNADILKVPGHGTRKENFNTFFTKVSPENALIPATSWVWCDSRGWQNKKYFGAQKIPVYINGIHGNVTVSMHTHTYKITPENPGAVCTY
ncbi:MAG: MBL fold metallo-hydrolase [Fibrobacteria bacterium]|nr:MBL fold metallo-hydrolase [Fibrobacteria bacterium]